MLKEGEGGREDADGERQSVGRHTEGEREREKERGGGREGRR